MWQAIHRPLKWGSSSYGLLISFTRSPSFSSPRSDVQGSCVCVARVNPMASSHFVDWRLFWQSAHSNGN